MLDVRCSMFAFSLPGVRVTPFLRGTSDTGLDRSFLRSAFCILSSAFPPLRSAFWILSSAFPPYEPLKNLHPPPGRNFSLLMIAIMLVGIVAFRQLPVSALPQVDYPTIQIQTFYPGASPDVMASSVTAPLERQFGQVPGLSADDLDQQRRGLSSIITLQFSLDLNIDIAEQEVQAGDQLRRNLSAGRSAQPADLQQDQSRRHADPHARIDQRRHARCPRWKTSPTRGWRKRSPSCPVSGWSASAAGSGRPCASRSIPRSFHRYGLNLEDVRTALAAANVNQRQGKFRRRKARAYTDR